MSFIGKFYSYLYELLFSILVYSKLNILEGCLFSVFWLNSMALMLYSFHYSTELLQSVVCTLPSFKMQ